MSEYDGAKVFINKQTFEFGYVKNIIGTFMGGSVGLVAGNIINVAIRKITKHDKYYSVMNMDDKGALTEFSNSLSVYAPGYNGGPNVALEDAYKQANLAYKNIDTVEGLALDHMSELAETDINQSLTWLSYYLEFKTMKPNVDNKYCRLYAIVMMNDKSKLGKRIIAADDEQILKELYNRYLQEEAKEAAKAAAEKKTPIAGVTTTAVNKSGDESKLNLSNTAFLIKLLIEYTPEHDNNTDADTDAEETQTSAAVSLNSVKDLLAKNSAPVVQMPTKNELLLKKRETFKALIKSRIESNRLVVKWGDAPLNLQQVAITQVNPIVNQDVLSFGVYALTVGYGAIMGAKYIGKLFK